MSDDERRISGDRLEFMRSALEAYAADDVGSDQAYFRATVREAVLERSSGLSRLADLFNQLAAATAQGSS